MWEQGGVWEKGGETKEKSMEWGCWSKGRGWRWRMEPGPHWLSGREGEKANTAIIPAPHTFHPNSATKK